MEETNGKKQDDSQGLESVIPNKFTLDIAGKQRTVKFGNLALARVEQKYGSITNIDKLQSDMEQKPMETIPWLLSISMKDMEGIENSTEGILSALDDSDLSIVDVVSVVTGAMESSLSRLNSGLSGEKKTREK
ncbi:MAG: hypothetical protein IJL80_01120 [Treponema sp.]|nr:hypothetical protein [Treponema sp.]